MKCWLLFLCIYCSKLLPAQDNSWVDSKVQQLPLAETYSTSSIAKYVQANFKTDKEKVRAIYAWVTSNIQYSKDSMYYKGWSTDVDSKTTAILRRRKGVCENYAELFCSIVSKCGIPFFMVTGLSKIGDAVSRTSHGWSAVYVDKEWLLCDPTWDIGFKTSPNYFLLKGEDFIGTHFPFDPLWQLMEYPVAEKEFRHGTWRPKKNEPVFHYNDSANAFMLLDTLQQLEAASARMQAAGIDNENVKISYNYNRMMIDIFYHDLDMNLFNAAVEDRNKARLLYNDFVQYRNERFKPAKTDADINAPFVLMDSLLQAAYKKAQAIGTKVENYQYNVDGLKNSLDNLSGKILAQKDFLKKYFAAGLGEREQLFYH